MCSEVEEREEIEWWRMSQIDLNRDSYIKIIGTNGNYRYGYIEEVLEKGWRVVVSLYDEGASKLAYDFAQNELLGRDHIEWEDILSEAEKRLMPMVARNMTIGEIAQASSCSPVTIRSHLRMMRIKLQVDDNIQLAALCAGMEKVMAMQ